MGATDKLPENLQQALSQGVVQRLPLTFVPFVNQQLHQWETLFPNERQSVERLLLYVARMSASESTGLFREVVELEEKMGVRHWEFSTAEQTIQNSSELARSPYFQQWRQAVQTVFDAADRSTLESAAGNGPSANRLILIDLPAALPLNAATAWHRWQGMGRSLHLDPGPAGYTTNALDALLFDKGNAAGKASSGLLRSVDAGTAANAWVIEAGADTVASAVRQGAAAVLLSYARLDTYRQNFSHEMNTMRKDLADADVVFDRLRKVDVRPWCPPEVAADAAVREFVRALYLSGNGAVIFGNSFVEWSASEAFRRARPSLLVARFGVRSKPKPFTGVAVFDNADQVNPLPAVDDPEGSAIDAQMLALYVWLAAGRYAEYQRATVCLCLAESIAQAYVVAPPEFSLVQDTEPVTLDRLGKALRAWMA